MPLAPQRIIIIGPSGSGKSELASRLAERLGYRAVDTDQIVEERIGMPISEFFGQFGEAAFRAIETGVLVEVCALDNAVVATGGGIVLDPRNWTIFRPGSIVVGLMASPATLVDRVQNHASQAGNSAVRPLLSGDPESRIREQLAVREPLYAQADVTIDTEHATPDDVAEQAEEYIRRATSEGRVPALSIHTPVERSDIYVRRESLRYLPDLIRQRWPKARRLWLITDDNVGPCWASAVSDGLTRGGYEVRVLSVPGGEASKAFSQVDSLCAEMTANGVSRRDVVVALGGGVVGDVGGFIAAVCLRGLSLVQLPTSLLAMVDSSVGGKTGINTASGKNLVGAFYQPGLVVIDPDFLRTLPDEEYRSGMAEIIKHAYIQPATPLQGNDLYETLWESSSLNPLPLDVTEDVLRLNVAIKKSVVQADERESRLRMILNFGHTAGHAIEADGYTYRHGEAVGLGMLVAGQIAEQLGRVNEHFNVSLRRLLESAGLPTRFSGRAESVIANLARDKKNIDGGLHWILPEDSGGVEIVSGVSDEVVRSALITVGAR